MTEAPTVQPRQVSLRELTLYFLRLGFMGFGGSVALLGQMERDLVEQRNWITREEMLEAVGACQMLPGPIVIQVGIFLAYLRGGFLGAWASGWAFIAPNFVIVALLGAVYVHFGDIKGMTGVFYGVGPAIIALILHSTYRLVKLGMKDEFQWLIALVCFIVTVAVETEVVLLFIIAGMIGAFYYGNQFRRNSGIHLLALPAQFLPAVQSAAVFTVAPLKIFLFFLKLGAFSFANGYVIIPFLQQGLVSQYGWLTEREFLIAIAIGIISSEPIVITSTFVGYLVAGFWGSLSATVGIFLPSFLVILTAAPIMARHRGNPNVQGFIKGAYGAAIGTILGACILLEKIAIGDWLTILISLFSLIVLFRWRIANPLLIAAAAIVGLIAFPLLQPTWVTIR